MVETAEKKASFLKSPENEKFVLNVDLVGSGRAGTGKTTTFDLFGQDVGIPRENISYTGKKFRQLAGDDSGGFMDRDGEIDKQIDDWQVDWLLSALDLEKLEQVDPRLVITKRLLEGRLAGLLLNRIRGVYPNIGVRSIRFDAPEEVRMNRLYERRLKKHANAITILEYKIDQAIKKNVNPDTISGYVKILDSLNAKDVTPESVQAEEKLREQGDLIHWRKVHSEFDFDPFGPESREFYDYIINTGKKSNGQPKTPEDVVEELKRKLAENGDAVYTSEKPPIAISGDIFKSEETGPLSSRRVKKNGNQPK